jgi:hypothetical protein
MPVFDKWSKGEVTIAITGDPTFDRTEAIKAWRANGGGQIPKGYVFHHDGLVTKEIKFKGVNLIVGRMQLVPEKLNGLVHVGSASLARRYVGDQVRAQNAAREINSQSFLKKGPLTKFAGRFKSKIPQAAKAFARASLPLVGGLLVLVEFSENAEAHGVGGAIIRGTPLLGDIVNVYDVASDLAATIEEGARQSIAGNLEELNAGVREATQAAAELTVDEFKRISQSIRVTNRYFEFASLETPVEAFFDEVYKLLLLRRSGIEITYPDDATPAEKELESPFNFKLRVARERLEHEIRLKCEEATALPKGPQA